MEHAGGGQEAGALRGKRLAVVGSGNMAEALVRGILRAGLLAPDAIATSDVVPDRLRLFREQFGVATETDNAAVVAKADVVLLAVKPQAMGQVLQGLVQAVERQLLISIAAGIPTYFIETRFDRPVRVVRVMPNTPALVLEGASALCAGAHATADDLALARGLFEAVGRAVVLDETAMDAVTGLSGSGPAYVFVIIEALADAGVRVGLSRDVARLLAAQTVLGSARMVLETGTHPAVLKDMVASPGGTTIAGLHALEAGALRAALLNAVEAATERSRELGRKK
jgi:pyrroline-5-carboxylate reductase